MGVKFSFSKKIKKNSKAKLILLLEGFNKMISQLTLAGIGVIRLGFDQ